MTFVRIFLLPFFLLFAVSLNVANGNGIVDFLKCKMCETKKMNGQINDCNCKFETVDNAVSNFFIPLLANITSRPFFRYFKIDLEKPCPFWEDDGAMCTNEGCSICPCEPDEVPIALLTEEIQNSKHEGLSDENEYGWISRAGEHGKPGGSAHSDRLGKVQHESVDDIHLDSHSRPLEQNWEWTEISEDSRGVFVNLVKNPEKFTGYSGLSARLVWKSIQEENCFGGDTDACFEKRVFYRLMSGLQSSITTQIARDYYFAPQGHDETPSHLIFAAGESHNGRWGPNIPMFIKAVGAHPSRIANLYFTFLFLTRAVAKAQDIFMEMNYSVGDTQEAAISRQLIQKLVTLPNLRNISILPDGSATHLDESLRAAVECSIGFDESSLFQSVPGAESVEATYWGDVHIQNVGIDLREEFRQRFRNISRIMDCVSCEKCRVWGKLEILGLGTAIKILLTPEKEMHELPLHHFLSRQEVVALINTLNQFAKSIHFASHAMEMEFGEKIEQMQATALQLTAVPLLVLGVGLLVWMIRRRKSKQL